MDRPKYESGIEGAIQVTIKTINLRGTYFRNFVICVTAVVLISLVCSGVIISWVPLLGLLLLVPICGILVYLDTFLVDKWQQQILKMWIQENLDLRIFSSTMSTIRTLPLNTLRAMLSMLPSTENDLSAQFSPDIRKALALTLKTINRCQNDRIIFTVFGYTLCSVFIVWAIIKWSWLPLFGFLFVIPIIGVKKWINFQRIRNWKKYIMDTTQQKKSILKDFTKAATLLDWGPILGKRESLLNSLNNKDAGP